LFDASVKALECPCTDVPIADRQQRRLAAVASQRRTDRGMRAVVAIAIGSQ
jgi:hypothetical protein